MQGVEHMAKIFPLRLEFFSMLKKRAMDTRSRSQMRLRPVAIEAKDDSSGMGFYIFIAKALKVPKTAYAGFAFGGIANHFEGEGAFDRFCCQDADLAAFFMEGMGEEAGVLFGPALFGEATFEQRDCGHCSLLK